MCCISKCNVPAFCFELVCHFSDGLQETQVWIRDVFGYSARSDLATTAANRTAEQKHLIKSCLSLSLLYLRLPPSQLIIDQSLESELWYNRGNNLESIDVCACVSSLNINITTQTQVLHFPHPPTLIHVLIVIQFIRSQFPPTIHLYWICRPKSFFWRKNFWNRNE